MVVRLQKFAWIVLVVIAVFWGGCTDNLLGKMKSNIRVSLAIPEASGSRNVSASINLDLHIKAWIEDEQGNSLELIEKPIPNGQASLSFQEITVGMTVYVKIQVSDASQVLYSGRSDFFEVSPEGNTVSVDLKRGDFASEQEKNEDEENGSTTGGEGAEGDGGEDEPAGSDGPTGDGGDDEPTDDGDENGAPSGGDGNESAGDGGPVGTVEVNFTVLKSDWEGLVDFSGNDLVIRGAMMGADGSSNSEDFEGDFGANTITFHNIPAETEVTAYVAIFYNPQQKYSYEEVAPADGSSLKYLLHINSSTSVLVKEGTNTVDIALTPYDMGGIAQNGYTHSCSSQEEIEDVIEYATDRVILSLAEDVHITDTITIDKEVSFMHLGDIIDIHVLPSLFWENSAGPMFEVTSRGNLDLYGIILDGKGYTGDDPLIVSEGDLYLYSCELINNNRSSTDKGVVYVRGGSLTISDTNITVAENYNGNALYMESGVTYSINNIDNGLVQSYTSITPASP